ncbi:MAG TPA: biotin synthase, partial [Clostridium sp.]|nr:biotin synthase [Clostridium sp.]
GFDRDKIENRLLIKEEKLKTINSNYEQLSFFSTVPTIYKKEDKVKAITGEI